MIAGQITLEDVNINFMVVYDRGIVRYTAWDGMTGASEEVHCNARNFMVALAIALDFDGGNEWPASYYERAETVQPKNKDLRFIP
jgi:hypothetical protein